MQAVVHRQQAAQLTRWFKQPDHLVTWAIWVRGPSGYLDDRRGNRIGQGYDCGDGSPILRETVFGGLQAAVVHLVTRLPEGPGSSANRPARSAGNSD